MGGRLMEGRPMDVDWQADSTMACAICCCATAQDEGADVSCRCCRADWPPGDRKSVQPMATRAGEVSHFIAAGVWDSAPLEVALLKKADGLVGDKVGFLVIDDTALPKKGCHSVGVAPQYA